MGQTESHPFIPNLPEDLWQFHIFPYLPDEVLWNLRFVCQFWNKTIPSLITRLNAFSGNGTDMYLLKKRCPLLHKLGIRGIANANAMVLCWDIVTHLDMRSAKQVDVVNMVSMTKLTHLWLGDVFRLTDSTISSFTNLQVLSLGECKHITNRALGPLTQLKELYLPWQTRITHSGFHHLAGLERVGPAYTGSFSLTNEDIRHLTNLVECVCSGDIHYAYMMRLTNLQSLKLYGSNMLDLGLTNSLKMTKLVVMDCPNVSDVSLLMLRNLRFLSISGYTKMTDRGLRCLDLDELYIHHFNGFTGVGLRTQKNLTCLNVDENVTIRDEAVLSLRSLRELEVWDFQRCNISQSTVSHINQRTWYHNIYLEPNRTHFSYWDDRVSFCTRPTWTL